MRAGALLDAVRPYIARGLVPGAIVGVWQEGLSEVEATGTTVPGGETLLAPEAQVRISSNTKPMVAALTLALAEDGLLALDDPVDRFLPELANRRVLRSLSGPIDETAPAERAPTIDDLLTMRLGFGFVLEAHCPAVDAAARAGLGMGPPDPSLTLTPDEWIDRFAALPLTDQPGSTWRYDLAYGVLGVALARAGGRPLGDLLRARIFEPLLMADTGFVAQPDRLPPSFSSNDGELLVFDDGADASRWSRPPAFPDARGGLVSTAADLLSFAGALLEGGRGVLSPHSIAMMTADHLTPSQRRGASADPFLGGSGWGYGVQVVAESASSPARYGWAGGLGTLWSSWPAHRAAAVLLTQVLPPSAELVDSFMHGAEASLGE